MDTLIRERNGKEEIWYSGEYLKKQIEIAYKSGIREGIRVEFHALEPVDGGMINNLVDEFNSRVEKQYMDSVANSEVWRVTK